MSDTTTIWGLLDQAAQKQPEKGLIFLENGLDEPAITITYTQLRYEAQQNARLLRSAGIVSPGQPVVTYFDSHQENITWLWSVIAAGGLPAVLSALAEDSATRAAQLENMETLFEGPTVITNQRLTQNLLPLKRSYIVKVESVLVGDRHNQDVMVANQELPDTLDSRAVFLYTSGSTGPAKAIEYSHAQLMASVRMKAAIHPIGPDTNFLSWISFDHSANFCEIHLSALYSASNQIHIGTRDVATEPARFFELLSKYQVGYTFCPNFFLAAATKSFLLRDEMPNLDLSALSVIMTGGEANKTSTIAAANELLVRFGAPQHTIKSAYGLSETCSACFYNLESPTYDIENGYVFASVGKHHPYGVQFRIVNDNGDESFPGSPGTVQLRGEVVFKRYHNNTSATDACMTSDGWFDTGDTGTLDRNGNLRIVGRSKEIIIINGNNYSSFELEHAIESRWINGLTPSYTATFSSWDKRGDSESVVVLFNPTDDASDAAGIQETIREIDRAVVNFCSKSAQAIIPLPKDLMPKSTIGKLSRRKLKESFEAGAFDRYQSQMTILSEDASRGSASGVPIRWQELSSMRRTIAEIFSRETGMSFEALLGPDALARSGIHSLGYMRIKKSLESAFKIHQDVPMSMLLRCVSVAELESALLSIGTALMEYDPIVPLSLRGSKQPLFLFHPGSGEFLCWMRLLPYLHDRPVYALRAKGLYKGEDTFKSLEELLGCYLDAIKVTQPTGPYAMLGYCFGGLLAFELAKRLEAMGDEVVFVGGIDNPPGLKRLIGQVRHRLLMIDVLPVVTSYTAEEAEDFGAETAGMSDEDFYHALFSKFSPEFAATMDITPSRLAAYRRVEDSLRQITSTYDPSGCVSKYDSFRADPMPHFEATPTQWREVVLASWAEYSQSEVRYHDIDGNHSTALKEPHLSSMQMKLNEALAARGI
ncbi:hypothetical protein MMC30_003115 [Trapelia coarctata]|nr:hypothetical protein [Trapelia coarctata]